MILTNKWFFNQQMSYSCCINITYKEQIFHSFIDYLFSIKAEGQVYAQARKTGGINDMVQ